MIGNGRYLDRHGVCVDWDRALCAVEDLIKDKEEEGDGDCPSYLYI